MIQYVRNSATIILLVLMFACTVEIFAQSYGFPVPGVDEWSNILHKYLSNNAVSENQITKENIEILKCCNALFQNANSLLESGDVNESNHQWVLGYFLSKYAILTLHNNLATLPPAIITISSNLNISFCLHVNAGFTLQHYSLCSQNLNSALIQMGRSPTGSITSEELHCFSAR